MKNIKISRPGQRCIRPGSDFDCDLCECGSPLTSTRETCSSGARMGASVSGRMHVLGDWHTFPRFKMSKLGVCAWQPVQLLESGLLRRLLPAVSGLGSRGGPLPAPSAHENPSPLFRAPSSSRKRLRRLLSRGSMAPAVCAVHTRAIYFLQSVSGCHRAASAPDFGPTGDSLSLRGRKMQLHLRPYPESASTAAKSRSSRCTQNTRFRQRTFAREHYAGASGLGGHAAASEHSNRSHAQRVHCECAQEPQAGVRRCFQRVRDAYRRRTGSDGALRKAE
jgi:hypothetical protein